MITSTSPRRVLQVASDAAWQALPAPRHKFSPKKFTQPQLLACVVLQAFLRLDSRGRAAHLTDPPDLTRWIDLKAVPPFPPFPKAADRLLRAAPAGARGDAVLERALGDKGRKRRMPRAAVDGPGWEGRPTRRSSVQRRWRTGSETPDTTDSQSPKGRLVSDCTSPLVLAAVAGRGPGADLGQFKAALQEGVRPAGIGTLLADADSDAAGVQEQGRGSSGLRPLIPPEGGRPSEKPPPGKGRRRRRQRLDRTKSGPRWPREMVPSRIQRRLGSALRARTSGSQGREITLQVITHNAMIVIRVRVFYRAIPHAALRHPS